jgi:hypothetical protein
MKLVAMAEIKLGGLVCFSTLHPNFFSLNAWNSPLVMGGGRGTFYLY